VIHGSGPDKLPVKEIIRMFNIGKTEVCEILKRKTKILKWLENCDDGKIKDNLRKLQRKALRK
jgi:hypothetical protein